MTSAKDYRFGGSCRTPILAVESKAENAAEDGETVARGDRPLGTNGDRLLSGKHVRRHGDARSALIHARERYKAGREYSCSLV